MRGAFLALTLVAAPALALAQTQGATQSGQAPGPTVPHAQTTAPHHTAGAPAAATNAPTTTTSTEAQTPPPTPPRAAAGTPPTVAASNVSLLHAIEPANALERAFVTAASEESARAGFRRLFLRSQVALATVATTADAAARTIPMGPGGEACLIFTSNARASEVMGAHAPRLMMTGRQALERVRGAPLLIININLQPYLTLDAAGIESFLALPAGDAAPTAPPPVSAGPSQ